MNFFKSALNETLHSFEATTVPMGSVGQKTSSIEICTCNFFKYASEYT